MESLNAQQRAGVDAVMQGGNVCILGAAGTGKSYVIKVLVQALKAQNKSFQILAPTGVSAVQIDGITIHRYFKIKPNVFTYDEYCSSRPRFSEPLPSVFIVDEISMVHPELLALMSTIAAQSMDARDVSLPFGGAQVVLLGDFFQLSYIDQRPRNKRCTLQLFETDIWRRLELSVHRLTTIVRQNEMDLIRPLTCIRVGKTHAPEVAALMARCAPKDGVDLREYVKLYSRNDDIEAENQRCMAAIPMPEVTFVATDWTRTKEDQKSLDHMLAKPVVTLKEGCRVMLIKNMPDYGVYNGSLGTVLRFTPGGEPVVRFDDDGPEIGFQVTTFEVHSYVLKNKKIACRLDAYRKQIPLVLAYAISIHKSQGMTISKVFVDLQGVFAFGQVYTALSRAKSLDGLVVSNFSPHKVPVDARVNAFYRGLISEESQA